MESAPIETASGEWAPLEDAVAEGALSARELESWKRAVERWGPLVAGLVRGGALGEATADRLALSTDTDSGSRTGGSGSGGDRYVLGELLGQGGMGEVYRAFDPGLRRWVALKLLRREDPEMVARFLREAQAQARIEHPAVCKVYETGLRQGRPYIAMQLIDGEPLFEGGDAGGSPSAPLASLGVEEKVRAMQRVAEGIQAAHREGLIHRDLKPSNILLERTSDGDLWPTIVDFGLAREVAAAGVTSRGLAVGTPHFMAPEQARGESSRLDRRTDVYGLGATLYAALSGAPPFEGKSSLDVMVRTLEEEAPLLRGVSADLSAIVAKCLEKEPSRRYDSARRLAEDLGRYLDGRPVMARRVSWVERLWKRARRHRALVTVSGSALVALMTLGAWSVRAEWRSREREALAQELGQEVKGIESAMRVAHLLPEHDLSEEKSSIRRRMAAIESRLAALGSSAEGPARYALGRGYLALGEAESARGELERAWEVGYRDPQVAYALGWALTELYRLKLQELDRLRDAEQRESQRRRLSAELRDPALRYLRASGGVRVDSPLYVEARVAFLEERYDDALEVAEEAWAISGGLYEAKLLAGDAHAGRMIWYQDHGEQEAAAERYAAAREAYREAAVVARSDPSPHRSLCSLAAYNMRAILYNRGGDAEEELRLGRGACEQALRIDPELGEAHQLLAFLFYREAEAAFFRGEDPLPSVERSVTAADAALALDRTDARAWNAKGLALLVGAQHETEGGDDPRATLAAAAEALDRAVALRPGDAGFHSDAGLPWFHLGFYELSHGGDARSAFEAAAAARSRATEIDPGVAQVWTNVGNDHAMLAVVAWQSGDDPFPSLDQAIAGFERAIEINPENAIARANLGYIQVYRATLERQVGVDPRPTLEAAETTLSAALELNPELAQIRAHLGYLWAQRARFALSRGEAPVELVEEALAHFAVSLEQNPELLYTLEGAADAARVLVELDVLQGRRPTVSTRRARRPVERMLEINPQSGSGTRGQAELHRLEAVRRLATGEEATEPIASGLAWVEKALEVNGEDLEALLLLGQLQTLEGRRLASAGGDPATAFAAGEEALQSALSIKADSVAAHLARAELALAEGSWRRADGEVARTVVARGLEAARAALRVNPTLAQADAVSGQLHLLAAEGEAEPAARRAASAEAAQALERAVSRNRLLENRLAADLQGARAQAGDRLSPTGR